MSARREPLLLRRPAGQSSSIFEALGRKISTLQRAAGLDLLVEEFGCEPLASDTAVRVAADTIERDEDEASAAAVMALMTVCDLTGAIRCIAVMCTEPVA